MSEQQLTEEQVVSAKEELVHNFPRLEKLPIDPSLTGQKYCSHSFIFFDEPKDGVYGLIKCRGNFPTEQALVKNTENIIRNVDTLHSISEGYVGHWQFLTNNDLCSMVTEQLDLKNESDESANKRVENAVKLFDEHLIDEAEKERTMREDILKRTDRLLEESSKREDKTSLDYYTKQRVKRDAIADYIKDVDSARTDCEEKLRNVEEIITQLDEEHPDYTNEWHDLLWVARKQVGIELPNAPVLSSSIQAIDAKGSEKMIVKKVI